MRVAIFLICLCYLLPGGYNYIYTGTHHNSIRYATAQHIEHQHLKFTNKNQHYTVIKEANSGKEGEYFISDAVEEEDTDNSLTRKYRLLARCYLILSGLLILSYLSSCVKTPRPFYILLSYKYITQRALRI